MKVVYIAGPFRAVNGEGQPDVFAVQQHIMHAMALGLRVWQTGKAAALIPHSNTMFFTGSAPDEVWLKGDLALLERCDALLTTSNWRLSSGARAEVDYAIAHDIPVFHDFPTLSHWL